MADKADETPEGEAGEPLKEKAPPKPVRLRKADAQTPKKKKEGAATSTRMRKAKPASNSRDENPLDWFTLNRCILLAVITILASYGINSLNETYGDIWAIGGEELTAEEPDLGSGEMTLGDGPEEEPPPETSLWDTLLSWSFSSRHDCDEDNICDEEDEDDDDCCYPYPAADEYDGYDDDEDDDDEDNEDADDAVSEEDDDAVDDDDDDDDDDDSQGGRNVYTVKRWKRLPGDSEEDSDEEDD